MNRLVNHIRHSFSLKLSLWLLFLTVAIYTVSMTFLFLHSRNILHQEAKERAFLSLNNTSLHVTRLAYEIETATRNAEWQVHAYPYPDSLLAITRRVTQLNPNIHGCSITLEPNFFPQYGRYFSAYSTHVGDSIETVREGEYEYFNKVWYYTPRTQGHPCWVDPFDDYNAGTLSSAEMIASFCVPLYNKRWQFFGVLSTDISLLKLSSVISSQKPYPNSYCMMLGQNGHFFVHPDTTKLAKETIFNGVDANTQPEVIALGHEMLAGKKGSMALQVDGKPCLVFYQPLGHTPWSIALVCPESDIYRGYNKLVGLVVFLTIAGFLLLLLLCHRTVAHFIAPLNQLAQQARRIAAGDFSERMPNSSRIDSIGQLQNNFVIMQQSLAKHISHLQEVNDQTKKSNEELLKANQLAEESQRKKVAFVQNMTHQIRTPLNIILGFAQVMRDNYHNMPDDELRSLNEMMEHNGVLISRMALMLIDSSPKGMTGPLPLTDHVSCNGIARESIEYGRQQYPYVTFKFETSLPDDFCIYTNHTYLLRSLRELIYNAAKYGNGEKVCVRVDATPATIRFAIEDTGHGLTQEQLDPLFDFFTKIDEFSEGLGLGLPLTKLHAGNLGGDLILDTDYKKGTRFVIEIPKNTLKQEK